MGNMGSTPSKAELSEEAKNYLMKIFHKIDENNNLVIDRVETFKFWSENFPKINTSEIFHDVDKNKDNKISATEWIDFWTCVLNSGYNENEIRQELEKLEDGESWVKLK